MLSFFLEYRQTHLLADFAKNKKMKKFQIIDQNHGPLEKYQFLDFFNFVILESKNAFFLSRISSNTFSCLILPKIERWNNFKFLTKTMDFSLWKNLSFSIFFLFLFLSPENTSFLYQNIVKHISWPIFLFN